MRSCENLLGYYDFRYVCTWSDSSGCLQFDASNSQCLHSSSDSLLSGWNKGSELYSHHVCFYANACCGTAERGALAVICREMGQICCSCTNLFGPDSSRNNPWFWLWERNIVFLHGQNKPKPDLSFAFQHLSLLVLFLFPFWITRLRSQDDLWMRSAYQNDCFFVFFSLLFFSLCLFPLCFLLYKCCEADAEGSVSKRCNVMGWACSVFERCLCLRSASGPVGENFASTLLPVVILHCLTLP